MATFPRVPSKEDKDAVRALRDLPARVQTSESSSIQVPRQQLNSLPTRTKPLHKHSRSRSSSSPPPPSRAPHLNDPRYDPSLAALANKVLYRSGRDPVSGGPLLVLNATAFPDANEIDYNKLLPYVLSNLPGDVELSGLEDGGVGGGYSVVFFAGGAGKDKANPPNWAWTLQAYHLLGRAVRKKIRKLWVVHERAWVRVLFKVMAPVVSSKFGKKVEHLNTLSDLADRIDITGINIPVAVYMHDRKLSPAIRLPSFPPPPTFGRPPFRDFSNPPKIGDPTPLPQVLVDTSQYLRQAGLEVEGIFRVPAAQAHLEIVRDAYDRRHILDWADWGPHTAAGITKLYYRSLPEPVIPQSCYSAIMKLVSFTPNRMSSATGAASIASNSTADSEKTLVGSANESDLVHENFETVRSLLTSESGGLPSSSRVLLLRHLFPLLSVVAQKQDANKMNPSNLAVCVAGSLARSSDVKADALASAGIRRFIEIGIERLEELAPKLPIRRRAAQGGNEKRKSAVIAEKRKSMSPKAAARAIERKEVPRLSMPTWEREEVPVVRKPVPGPGTKSLENSPVDRREINSPLVAALERAATTPLNSAIMASEKELGTVEKELTAAEKEMLMGKPIIGRRTVDFSSTSTRQGDPESQFAGLDFGFNARQPKELWAKAKDSVLPADVQPRPAKSKPRIPTPPLAAALPPPRKLSTPTPTLIHPPTLPTPEHRPVPILRRVSSAHLPRQKPPAMANTAISALRASWIEKDRAAISSSLAAPLRPVVGRAKSAGTVDVRSEGVGAAQGRVDGEAGLGVGGEEERIGMAVGVDRNRPVIRRVRSAAWHVGREAGVVGELARIWEEKARASEVLKGFEKR